MLSIKSKKFKSLALIIGLAPFAVPASVHVFTADVFPVSRATSPLATAVEAKNVV